MKKIIVLKGEPDSGKSKTLTRLVNEIFEIKIYRPTVRKDLVISFKYKNKTIAVMTIGDVVSVIEEYLKDIKEFDILICSCREGGKTFEFFNKFHEIDGYDVEFIDKHKDNYQEEDEILSKIKEMISKEFNE